ncbi:WD40 repeat domain-containing protein, partial [Streptomyces sp. SBT349]|uniref:WD40 repeat domain-containing protein n=1 Tax=Streptomyces sp. SBT349 TaxID=1580539 RepID=UPI003B6415DD
MVLGGHQGFVRNVAISPEGRWIAGTGKDGTVRLRDTEAALTGFAASVDPGAGVGGPARRPPAVSAARPPGGGGVGGARSG